ncbi:hypothetical protein H2199_004074 [Coniosporium tulheliwenetii]|uniref:Uncharacterized protein n=1 Tax=Coniosporium tulheliwenetii TaxID=3383036 RepID=A0ACC2Z6X0_9PEZI|nr:hypothetical protein H2199_004074 [Cladosporium sp. JES 115]
MHEIALCHCLTCQKVTGSAFSSNLLIPIDSFHVTQGTPKQVDTTHENGMRITLHMCAECGTMIYKEGDSDDLKGMAIVQAGTLDEGLSSANPDAELWIKHRPEWLGELKGVGQAVEFQ